MKAKVVIVDEGDNIIGHKLYDDINFPSEIYRVSRLWVTDREENVLLQKRSDNLNVFPGRWGCAAAGTNDEGETYETNIIKEAKEEIGLSIVHPMVLHKRLERYTGERNVFCTYFIYKLDTVTPEVVFDNDEVSKIKWFSPDELKEFVRTSPGILSPDIPDILSDFRQ